MQAYFLYFRPHCKGRKQCEKDNYSEVMTKWRLPGLTDVAEVQPVLLVVCLVIYLTLVIGNVPTSLLMHSDSTLHTPVCFFLSHLPLLCRSVSCHEGHPSDAGAFLIQGKGKQISFLGCSIQFHFFIHHPGDHTMAPTNHRWRDHSHGFWPWLFANPCSMRATCPKVSASLSRLPL